MIYDHVHSRSCDQMLVKRLNTKCFVKLFNTDSKLPLDQPKVAQDTTELGKRATPNLLCATQQKQESEGEKAVNI